MKALEENQKIFLWIDDNPLENEDPDFWIVEAPPYWMLNCSFGGWPRPFIRFAKRDLAIEAAVVFSEWIVRDRERQREQHEADAQEIVN